MFELDQVDFQSFAVARVIELYVLLDQAPPVYTWSTVPWPALIAGQAQLFAFGLVEFRALIRLSGNSQTVSFVQHSPLQCWPVLQAVPVGVSIPLKYQRPGLNGPWSLLIPFRPVPFLSYTLKLRQFLQSKPGDLQAYC